jgi:hypothetical protein
LVSILPAENYIEEIIEPHGLSKAKPCSTPGTSGRKTTDGVSALNDAAARDYRGTAGKLMWLIPISSDINYAVKELSRGLQNPTDDDLARARQVVRYLIGTKDYEYTLIPTIQTEAEAELEMNVYVDSDWAGCKTTRKSTSGGVIYVLGVAVHHYSRTQQTIATSSGEAELYAIGSGVCEGLGIANMITESGLAKSTRIFVHTDSTCAKAIATRIGTSKNTKHIDVRQLFVQDLTARGLINIKKVHTSDNPAFCFD